MKQVKKCKFCHENNIVIILRYTVIVMYVLNKAQSESLSLKREKVTVRLPHNTQVTERGNLLTMMKARSALITCTIFPLTENYTIVTERPQITYNIFLTTANYDCQE